MRSRGATLGSLVVVVAGLALAEPAAALPQDTDEWLQVESSHFRLFSNAKRRKAQQVAADLEKLHAVLSRLVPRRDLRSTRPTFVFVFKDTASFRDYGVWVSSIPGSFPGFFLSRPDGHYVALDASASRNPTRILYHEYLHTILDNHFPGLPLWFNEGLAEYYSTFQAHGDEAHVGRPVRHHIQWIRLHGMRPLEELFAATSRSKSYNEASKRGAFYAQSWAMVHYLLTASPQRRAQTSSFLSLLGQGKPIQQAFDEAFQTEPDALLEEVWKYLHRAELGYTTVPVPELDAEKHLRTGPLSRAELLFRLGDLLAHLSPLTYREAEKHYRAALEHNGRHAGALAGLGWVAEIERDEPKALRYYEQAIAERSTDFQVYLRHGRLLLDPLMRASAWRLETDPGAGPVLRAARSSFRRSIALRPDCAEAYAALGATYLFETTVPTEAIEALLKAFSMEPFRTDIASNIVALYAKRGERERAKRWIDQVLRPRAAPSTISKAEEALLLADVAKARDLLHEGRFSDGLRLLDNVLHSTSDQIFRADVESLRARASGPDGSLDLGSAEDR
jgi:tetratricopeptide (TPR) repeat protein